MRFKGRQRNAQLYDESASQKPAERHEPHWDLYQGDHLFTCFELVSQAWETDPQSARESAALPRISDDVPTFESLKSEAHKHGLSIKHAQRPLNSLDDEDFPCILLLTTGRGILVSKKMGKAVTAATSQGNIFGSLSSLKDRYSGVVISLSPLQKRAVQEDGGIELGQIKPEKISSADIRRDPHTSSHSKRGIFSIVLSEIMTEHKSLLGFVLLAATLSNMLMIALPLFIRIIYDRVIPHLAIETLWALSIGIGIALMLDLAIRSVRLKMSDAIGLGAATKLKTVLFRKLVNVKMEQAPRQAGSIVAAVKELDSIATLMPNILAAALIDVPFILIILGIIYAMAGPVVLAPIIGIAVIAIAHVLSYRKILQSGAEDAKFQHGQMDMVIETISTLETTKATSSQPRLLNAWERMVDSAAKPNHDVRYHSAYTSQITMIIVQVVIVLTVLIGVYQIGEGAMSVGVLAATTLFAGRVLTPVGSTASMLLRLAQSAKAGKIVLAALKLPEEVGLDKSNRNSITKGHIAFKNVSFTYPEASSPAINSIALNIQPGEKVAIVGRNGSGKSTLMKLFIRYYEQSHGDISVDGFNAAQIDPVLLRNKFAYMPQDNTLFSGTVLDNLRYGLEEFDETHFAQALNVSGVDQFINGQSEGFSLQVGAGGERLSGGERQSIALARTLARRAKVYLLDEPTSSMDNTAEGILVQKLRSHIDGSTLIVSTHRAQLLALVDRVIWLDKGKIVADGPRDEVLARLQGK